MLFGITKIFERLRHTINAHTTRDERREVNFAFGDGSVRSLQDSIEPAAYSALGSRNLGDQNQAP